LWWWDVLEYGVLFGNFGLLCSSFFVFPFFISFFVLFFFISFLFFLIPF